MSDRRNNAHCTIPDDPDQSTLCLAKNASADMSLCSNAIITVMQTPELWDLDNPADTSDLPGNRALLVEA